LKPLKSSNFRREDRPLTVIAGYLGAGKTTLINRMLADAVAPFAVIVNDLGALAVDQALIAGQQGSTLTLTNGCACCQISADLAAQLERLRQDNFSALVFEASGVAKASRLATLTSQAEGYALAKVVTLVDGLDAPRLLSDAYLSPLIKEQIAAADWVLQTKRSEGVHPSLASISSNIGQLPSSGALPAALAPEYFFDQSGRLEAGIKAPLFQHRVIFPRPDLTPGLLEAFIVEHPEIERVKGWLVGPTDAVLVQATRAHFQARSGARAQGQGLQFIWRGDAELDFSALT
jgi:hypothetical protein